MYSHGEEKRFSVGMLFAAKQKEFVSILLQMQGRLVLKIPPRSSGSKREMSCIVLIAANLRHIKIPNNLFSVLCFFYVIH